MAKTVGDVEFKRVSVNLPVSIYEKIKDYGIGLGLNFTSSLIVILNQALEQRESMSALPLLSSMLDDMKNGNYSDIEKLDKTKK